MTRLVTQPEQPELIEDGPTASQIRDMHNLASELKERALLILGLNFSDWLVRFFMRIAKQRRLSQREQERTEYLAEGRPELLPESMVLFFGTLTKSIQIVQCDPSKFAADQFADQSIAIKEPCRRLYNHYRAIAPQLPDSFRDMEPLFLAVICGCHAGLFLEALHQIYIPQIQRGNASFAANVIGARGAVLSVLAHFFENGCGVYPPERPSRGQSLTADDQLYSDGDCPTSLLAGTGTEEPCPVDRSLQRSGSDALSFG
jgi:hypothetical protein